MGGDQAMIAGPVIVGVGCRRDCPADHLVAVVRKACETAGRVADTLAAPAFKAHEPGLRAAAARLGLALVLIERDALEAAQPRCPTVSDVARDATGLASVAEACALAAAGAAGSLVLPRVTHGGATCALAARA